MPCDHDESNYKLAAQALLDPLGVSQDNRHRIPGELLPGDAAQCANQDFARYGRGLDLVFWGMGEDGHVASLFPGDLAEEKGEVEIFGAVVAVKPPPHRVTLSYHALRSAAAIWVLASGPGKEAALVASLRESRLPLGRVRAQRDTIRVYTELNLGSETHR